MKERLIWLDNLKAFLIFIVVLGHTILFSSADGSDNVAYRYISSFWMACFMFTSGFASYREPMQKGVVPKRFKQLVIPYIVWTILLGLINQQCSILELFLYPTKSVWFLWVLFLIVVLQFVVCKMSDFTHIKSEVLSLCVFVLLVISCKLVKDNSLLGFGMVGLHYINYVAGFYARKYFCELRRLPKLVWYGCSILFVVCAFFNQGNWMPLGLPSSMHIMFDMICGLLSFALFVPLFCRFANHNMLSISQIGGGVHIRHIHFSHCILYNIIPVCFRYSY